MFGLAIAGLVVARDELVMAKSSLTPVHGELVDGASVTGGQTGWGRQSTARAFLIAKE